MNITIEQLRLVSPHSPPSRLIEVVKPLNESILEFGIDTPRRFQPYVAQLAHESGGFRYTREQASGAAYEGRSDLGNSHPGDGPRFKGWGWMQTTGRKNTMIVSLALYGDARLVDDPKLIDPPALDLCARAAGHFWTVGAGLNLSKRAIAHGVPVGCNLNDLADAGDFKGITLAINGGMNGYDDRMAYFDRAQEHVA